MTAVEPRSAVRPHVRTSWLVLLVAGAAFVLLAWWLVPWDPVPGGRPEPVDPEDYFTAAQITRAEEFSGWARTWSLSSLGVSLLVACVVGFTSLGRRLVARLPGPWWAQVVLTVAALEVAGRVITLPFAVLVRRLVREYGLSTQSWWGFARDLVVSEALTVVVTSVGLLALVWCARRFPRRWPAIAGGVLGVLVLLGSFVYPLLVEPLFNDFEPLEDGSLRSSILALADAEGVEVDEVLVADASRRTTTLNAYVSGFGQTRRVVLYDTLVQDLPEDQALSVVAHELVHARHDDVLVGSVLGAVGVAAVVGLGGVLLRRRDVGRASTVPLLLALLAVGTVLAAPLQNGLSRAVETRADVEALRYTGDAGAFVELQRQLAVRSLADPSPPRVLEWWFASHDGALRRIGLALPD
ncbi:heat shock protein HtpX [Nocardioides dokdonensis FR1436]|uniref:Heat shock protein HtpX n=1 Tax=Nocardioides dokdonensis FR1436 TaxID=1300347 RepID=A0A1A9GNA7_9ACTN|nr:M48 family metalloprotease [Nocardioides dokdonensis]ANH39083.1 heat shock protein HtpX [Nocardioides dokdonensis FR1436]